MRYRNSECCVTPDELAVKTAKIENLFGDCNKKNQMDWNCSDGWHDKDNCDNDSASKCDNECECNYEDDIKRRLRELQFAAIDLNLFLDTHPCDEEALAMFKKINKTIEAVKIDYIKKYGPLKACDSSENAPFEWVDDKFKWPWEK